MGPNFIYFTVFDERRNFEKKITYFSILLHPLLFKFKVINTATPIV